MRDLIGWRQEIEESDNIRYKRPSALTREEWPPRYEEVWSWRYNALQGLKNNPEMIKSAKKYYSTRPLEFIIDWMDTYDPRPDPIRPDKPKWMPFILFDKQVQFIKFLRSLDQEQENGLNEKARDMGATWLACAYSIWCWLFIPGDSTGWGSRKQDLVDRIGDADSIFEKMRLLIRRLPKIFWPEGFVWGKHATFMKMINPENGSTIMGDAGDSIGRGGRKTRYFKDESAHYERPERIEAALGDNTRVQIDISSVNGTGNVFYRRRTGGELWQEGIKLPRGKTRVFIFDWRDHPAKDQVWYDIKRQKAEDDGLLHVFAQETDRDYNASVDGIIIPGKWINAAIDAHIQLGFEPSGAKIAALDVADEGGDKNAWGMRHGVVLMHVDHWGEGDTGETSQRAVSLCMEYGVTSMQYDSIGVGAGVKSDTNRMIRDNTFPKNLKIIPWNASASPLFPEKHMIEGDKQSPKNEDFFLNLKTQGWWALRDRFRKTYQMITQNKIYPFDELISIPSNINKLHELKTELSQPVFTRNSAGKTLVDKKPEGSRSPNLADMVMMCYHPVLAPKGFFDIN